MYISLCVVTCKGQKKVPGSLELELEAVVNALGGAGSTFGSSIRAADVLIAESPLYLLNYFYDI